MNMTPKITLFIKIFQFFFLGRFPRHHHFRISKRLFFICSENFIFCSFLVPTYSRVPIAFRKVTPLGNIILPNKRRNFQNKTRTIESPGFGHKIQKWGCRGNRPVFFFTIFRAKVNDY